MPKLAISPDVGVSQGSARKWLLAQAANVLTKSPGGSAALAFHTVVEKTYEWTGLYKGPLGQMQYDIEKAWWHPDYQASTSDIYNRRPGTVNYLSPVRQVESGRASSLSYQQSASRPGTSKKSGMIKPTWKSGGKGGKMRPSCPSGHKLRRVGKRLMCVKSS